MARIFVYDGRRHDDPDPAATEEEVREMMTHWYPDIANATVERERDGADSVVVFRRRVGNKGYTAAGLAGRLLETPPATLELVEAYAKLKDEGRSSEEMLEAMSSGGTEKMLDDAEQYATRAQTLAARVAGMDGR